MPTGQQCPVLTSYGGQLMLPCLIFVWSLMVKFFAALVLHVYQVDVTQ